jgi:hypothetical protein
MAKKVISFQQFTGGLSDSPKVGIKNSSAYLQGFDVRTDPGQMSVLPGMVREDNNIVKDLILNEVMVADGTIYAFGDQGYIYKRTPAGAQSVFDKLSSGCAGMDYRHDTDAVYFAGNKTVSFLNPVSKSPALFPDKYASSYSTYDNSINMGLNVSAYQVDSTLVTNVLTTFNESQDQTRFFQSDIEPLTKVSVFIVNKGTGDWTLTLHDGLNTVLGSVTITNSNLNNGSFNDFVFASAPNGQVRIYPAPNARTYHIHVTSTVADGTISSTVTNNMSTCDLEVWADRLIQTNSGWHPIDRFLQYELIGNANYISAWEPISDPPTNDEWLRHRLTVPSEYECVGLDHTNEFSVAAFGQTTTNSNQVPTQGLLTFWDGLSDTYNYDVPIAEGTPQCLHVFANVIYYYAAGKWWYMTSATTEPTPLKQLPGAVSHFTGAVSPIVMYPYAATVQSGIQLLAWPGLSTNPAINAGVYSWVGLNKNYPQVLSYDYLPSTGSQNYSSSNNLKLGMVKSYEGILHLSWRDDQGSGTPKYGIDVITPSSLPTSYAKYQSLVISNGYAAKTKVGAYVEAYFPNLPAGATITLGYSINRGAFVVDTQTYSMTNLWQGQDSYARFDVSSTSAGTFGGRFREIQAQVEVRSPAGTTLPAAIVELNVVIDDMREEQLR